MSSPSQSPHAHHLPEDKSPFHDQAEALLDEALRQETPLAELRAKMAELMGINLDELESNPQLEAPGEFRQVYNIDYTAQLPSPKRADTIQHGANALERGYKIHFFHTAFGTRRVLYFLKSKEPQSTNASDVQ